VPDFGRVFLTLKYADITQNTYVQSLNSYGDNGQRKVWSSGGSTYCTCQLTVLFITFIASEARTIFQCKDTRIKVLKCCANIYFNKIVRSHIVRAFYFKLA